jgi:hypothetical protein
MKRKVIYTILMCIVGFGIAGCYKDYIIPETATDPDGPPQFVSYNAELKPLFNTDCAKSGCHLSRHISPT